MFRRIYRGRFEMSGAKRPFAPESKAAAGQRNWRVNTRLVEAESTHVHTPQLVLVSDRLALLYWTSKGLWLQRGRLTKDGPRLGPAQQITNHRFDGRGARLMRDGDDVYLPLPARPPLLLRAKLADLLGKT